MKIPRSSPPGTFWPGSGRLKNHGPDQPVWAVFLWTLVQQNPEIGDGALRRVAADNFPRRAVPADNAHDSLQQIVTSLPRPPGCPRWQCARQLSANRYFPAPPGIGGPWPLTISHGGFLLLVFSLTRPVTLPGGNRSADPSPPCQRGVVWRSQTGGIPQACGIPHWFVF